jgi:hypothetical protein
MQSWGSGGIAALDGNEWSASRPSRFTPGGESPQYPSDRRMGGPHNRSGHYREEKNLAPAGNPDRPAHNPSIYRLSYPGY